MKIRITGRRLVPAALAAASVLALAAPANAAPPDPLVQGEESREDCLRALKVLTILRLLPDDKPELADALCADKKSKGSDQETRGSARDEQLFNVPDLPKSLTVRIPDLARQQR
ncbi:MULTISPECIES: hypothetical protein [Actinomadura]|uniref:Secreted protein n=1 Tax=Actinomadura litoris TaxID=2678616 RepID=A0A7K1L3H3_9ACTN|nr:MULTISPECIES: hypothetical protein [Actinomadura]MBT2213579.1 hypothetical protein [Actinomadura sp. NEAU-AAG7]MUN38959.1 hypothetical protein [Actinomadura litoris]